MSMGITPEQNAANSLNSNKGTNGFNTQYLQAQINKSNQLNPNNALFQPKKRK